MPDRIVTIGPSGCDYTSLAAAIAGESDFQTGEDNIVFRYAASFADASASVAITGFTTSAAHRVIVEVPATYRHNGARASGARIVADYGYNPLISVLISHVTIRGLEVRNTGGGGTGIGNNLNNNTGITDVIIEDCLVYGCASRGISLCNVIVSNCLVYECGYGMYFGSADAAVYVYDSTVLNCTMAGIFFDWAFANFTVRNSYCGGNGVDYDINGATVTLTTCRSSDGSESTTTIALADCGFTSYTSGSENANIGATSDLIGIGTDLSSDSIYPVITDCFGAARASTPCIGAVEYVNLSVTGLLDLVRKKSVIALTGSFAVKAMIINHTHVALYQYIPEYYKNIIKTKWFNVPGESHSAGYRNGLQWLSEQDSSFAASRVEEGNPEGASSEHLRVNKATWGDLNNATGWQYWYGEEDWFTSEAAVSRTKAHLQYCHDNSLEVGYMGFGWCWDMTANSATAEIDPVYKCHWYGASLGGPDGNIPWGLDAADETVTGNVVCMDTYITATKEFIDYCAANGINTKVFYTTGPADSMGESAYQREVKHQYIRDYIAASGGWLFDYADILAWDNAGEQRSAVWTDGDGGNHTYPWIAADNLLNFDGNDGSGGTGHIGERGELRLAKAVWVMAAMMEGWDGSTDSSVTGNLNLTRKKSVIALAGSFASGADLSVTGALSLVRGKSVIAITGSFEQGAIPVPGNPDLCRLYVAARNIDGTDAHLDLGKIYIGNDDLPYEVDGITYSNANKVGVYDSVRRIIYFDVIKGLRCHIDMPSLGYNHDFTVPPNESLADLSVLIT